MKDTNRLLELADYIGNILLAHLFLVLAGVYLLRKKTVRTLDKNEQLILWIMGAGPVVLTFLLGLFVPLYYRWVIPMLPMITILSAMLLKGRFDYLFSRKALIVFLIIQLLLGLSYLFKDRLNPGQSSRGNYPSPEIAHEIYADWHRVYPDHPFKIVSGGEWQAGFVSLFSPDKTYVFTQANTILAPWISAQDVQDCGMVMIEPTQEQLAEYPLAKLQPPIHLIRPKYKDEFEVHYAISPPQGNCQLQ
jgi:hypothetical protein